jgi:regulatory protein
MTWSRHGNDLTGDAEKIFSASLAYLTRRDYAVAELRHKLLQRGADEQQLELVLARLRQEGYLDDARFAAAFVRDRREFRPCGAAMIRHELALRGVDEELIEAALEAEYGEEQQRQALRKLLAKAQAKLEPAPQEPEAARKYRERLYRRLLVKGFPQGMIFSEINKQALNAADEKKNIDRGREK